jgi:hypothetical protein
MSITTSILTAAAATIPSPTSTFQNLQESYGPQAQAFGNTAENIYYSHLTTLEVFSVIFSAAFIAGSIYFLIQTGWLANRVDRVRDVVLKSDSSKKRIRSTWDDIERHFFAGDDNDLKVALIEADNLLNDALLAAGVQGVQLGDRLKKVRSNQLPNLEEVWQAHKIRNRIAHEANFVLKRDLAERALTVYETALEHLGVLEPEAGSPAVVAAVAKEGANAKKKSGEASTEAQSHSPH